MTSSKLYILVSTWSLLATCSSSSSYLHKQLVSLGQPTTLSLSDRLAILEHLGQDAVQTSDSEQECLLKRIVTNEPEERCENLTRRVCNDELVLKRKWVVEDCSVHDEFCETINREHSFEYDSVLCQTHFQTICDTHNDHINEELFNDHSDADRDRRERESRDIESNNFDMYSDNNRRSFNTLDLSNDGDEKRKNIEMEDYSDKNGNSKISNNEEMYSDSNKRDSDSNDMYSDNNNAYSDNSQMNNADMYSDNNRMNNEDMYSDKNKMNEDMYSDNNKMNGDMYSDNNKMIKTEEEEQNKNKTVSESPRSSNRICHNRRVAVCHSEPSRITLTELKMRCNGENRYTTTRFCITDLNGFGNCHTMITEKDICEDKDQIKIVSNELGKPILECNEPRRAPAFCHSANCPITKRDTKCISQKLPKSVTLKTTTCEKCLEGRRKIRPVLETRRICRRVEEEYCVVVQKKSVDWRKWCLSKDQIERLQKDENKKELENNNNNENKGGFGRNDLRRPSFHVEVSPGDWRITHNETEANVYLDEQARREASYATSETTPTKFETTSTTTFITTTTSTTTVTTTATTTASAAIVARKTFLDRILSCTREPLSCFF